MTMVKKSWMAVVMGALLLGTLVGVVWARPNDRPQAADITRKVTVPAAFFHPFEDGFDWQCDGNHISSSSGSGGFMAPVVFPCLPSVTVERLILYANDQNGSEDACAWLAHTTPQQGKQRVMGNACTTGTTTGIQPFIDSTIDHDVVWPSQGVFIQLDIDGPSINVWAVTIEYHRNL